MPKCDACRAKGAKLRCHKCQGCWSCKKACAKRFWSTHKRFCTDDPALKPHVPIELAIERALPKAPKTEPPPNATCYICLETGGPNSDNVMRGCACRGPSAGFAHVDCLAEMASRDEWIDLGGGVRESRWSFCPTCLSPYVGLLKFELQRREWRRIRDDPPSDARSQALAEMACSLTQYDEVDAADRLDEESTRGLARSDPVTQLQRDVIRANSLNGMDRYNEALEILTRTRPSVERHTADLTLRSEYALMMAVALANLDRCREALPFAVEAVERFTEAAGPESQGALGSVSMHAQILARLGQVGEAKATLERLLATQTRVLGAKHPRTLDTKRVLEVVSSTAAARAVERP